VRHSSNCIRVACAYRVGTVRYTRRGVRPNGRKTREYVRGRWVTYTWARTLCTRRAAPRRAARAALCVYRCVKAPLLRRRGARGGGGEGTRWRKWARPKVKPNSFSVRLEAAGRVHAGSYLRLLITLPALPAAFAVFSRLSRLRHYVSARPFGLLFLLSRSLNKRAKLVSSILDRASIQ